MQTRTKRILGIVGIVAVSIVVVVLWPAPDPLAHADTVAIRVGNDEPSASGIDYREELGIVLSGRNLRIVSDESTADVVLVLNDFRVSLGDIEISLTNGQVNGRASAVCVVTDVRTGEVHTMDFLLRFENGDVRADLVARKFWQFWK
jgi:hypothetical protein